MSPFAKLQEAIKSGTPGEVKAARMDWQADMSRACGCCGKSGIPLHAFLGIGERVCEPCDADIRAGHEEWADQQAHERLHAAGAR